MMSKILETEQGTQLVRDENIPYADAMYDVIAATDTSEGTRSIIYDLNGYHFTEVVMKDGRIKRQRKINLTRVHQFVVNILEDKSYQVKALDQVAINLLASCEIAVCNDMRKAGWVRRR